MRVRVLMENSGPDHLVSEHGLSLLVEREESCCLLDAGTTGRFADNARTLGVDLDRVDAAALSHGHYDHANGFWAFFRENDHAPVVARSAATQPHYSRGRYIGADPALWEEYGQAVGGARRPGPRALPGGGDRRGPGGDELLLPRRGMRHCSSGEKAL